ncbi:hydrolase TatD [bacterium]|nr:MAG: hydrolase TatD [bacterium]RIK63716.1 MAG: hydrolase TatD [Planctomycetota bacterium]
MRIFEPHIHMISRVTDDYERMAAAGVCYVNEPQFWLGQPRTNVGSFIDYFAQITEYEVKRAADFGIKHVCCIGLNPKESNDDRVNKDVMAILPQWLKHPTCVAIGEIGLDSHTPKEEEFFRRQLELGKKLKMPVLMHTPHRDKLKGTRRMIDICKEVGNDPNLLLIDHNNEETIPITKEAGFWAGHTVYPVTKLSPERATNIFKRFGVERMMVNSSADWGVSDPLNVPKTVGEMRRAGFSEAQIQTVVWDNPFNFFAQSGKLDDDRRKLADTFLPAAKAGKSKKQKAVTV